MAKAGASCWPPLASLLLPYLHHFVCAHSHLPVAPPRQAWGRAGRNGLLSNFAIGSRRWRLLARSGVLEAGRPTRTQRDTQRRRRTSSRERCALCLARHAVLGPVCLLIERQGWLHPGGRSGRGAGRRSCSCSSSFPVPARCPCSSCLGLCDQQAVSAVWPAAAAAPVCPGPAALPVGTAPPS